MRKLCRRLRRHGEAGYSLIELLITMAALATILAAVTTVFVEGSTAEVHANNRFQAQLSADGALDRLRRDVHCSSAGAVTGSKLTLSGCSFGDVSWCSVGSGTNYTLYRKLGDVCDSSGKLYSQNLIQPATLSYACVAGSGVLATVPVTIIVNPNPARTIDNFTLSDTLVLRNGARCT